MLWKHSTLFGVGHIAEVRHIAVTATAAAGPAARPVDLPVGEQAGEQRGQAGFLLFLLRDLINRLPGGNAFLDLHIVAVADAHGHRETFRVLTHLCTFFREMCISVPLPIFQLDHLSLNCRSSLY